MHILNLVGEDETLGAKTSPAEPHCADFDHFVNLRAFFCCLLNHYVTSMIGLERIGTGHHETSESPIWKQSAAFSIMLSWL